MIKRSKNSILILCGIANFLYGKIEQLPSEVSYFLTAYDTHAQVKAFVYVVPSVTESVAANNLEAGRRTFYNSVFNFLTLLEEGRIKKVPVIIVMPKEYNNLTPVCSQAPWIEGARTALAWASACYRFKELGNVDIRILHVSQKESLTIQALTSAVASVCSISIADSDKESEIQVKNRIFSFEDLAQSNTITIPLTFETTSIVEQSQFLPVIINSKLNEIPSGKQRVLVTGGSGFIGCHIVKELLEQGHQVIALDNLLCSSLDNLKEVKSHENFEFHQVDVSQPFEINGPLTSIVHLASAPSPMFYYTKPKETLMAGLQGTKNTLDLAVKKGARYLYSSSSEVYGDPEITPQSEEYPGRVNPIGKRSQYDQSKRGGETLIKVYFELYGIDVRIVRIFNTYGPHMNINDGRVVTNFIKALFNNEPFVIYGDGLQTRSFAYVSDTVSGILKVLQADKISIFKKIDQRIFNVGNPLEFTINELAQKVNKIAYTYMKREAPIKRIELPDKDDPKMRRPNINRAFQVVGYNPIISVEEGLEKTFLFFKEQLNN